MQKWKKVLSGFLAGVMILECGLAAKPMQAQAEAQTESAAPGTVYRVYSSFKDGTELGDIGVDPEFGNEHPVTLNTSTSPRVIELQYKQVSADNGKMLATFECNRLPKTDKALVAARQENGDNINENLSSFPIYESIDGGRTWGAGEAEKPARGENYVPVGYVQNQNSDSGTVGMRNCPQIYEMPETVGNLAKGTIICAGNSIEAGTNGAGASAAQSTKTNLDLCISTDLGRNWTHHSTIVGPIDGECILLHNTVWEPFFVTFDGKLYCFYSDEAFDDTTDQDISYVVYDGTNWSEKRRIIYSAGQRPGMPIVSQLEDGRFMLTYEIEGGGGLGSGYILSAANDLTKWYDADGNLKDTVNGEFVAHNTAKVVNGSGAPYNITTDKKTVLYNNTSLGQIWANSSKKPDEEGAFWRYYHTGITSAYNRQILQLANKNIFVIAGTASGVECVALDYEMDTEKTGYLQSKIASPDGKDTYLAYNNSPLFVWTGVDGHAEPNQYYEFQEIEDGVYILVSTNNGKAVGVETTEAGSKVNTFAKNVADVKQHWVFEEVADGYYRVKNIGSDLYLTSPRTQPSDAMDMNLTMEERQESDSQLWKSDVTFKKSEDESGKKRFKVTLKEDEGVEVTAAASVVEGRDLNLQITKKEGCKSIDKVLINGEEKQFTLANGIATVKVENVQADLNIEVKATLEDYFVSVPTNKHHGRNQCLSPRVVEALDGKLYCTFESAVASEAAGGEFVFPIYESEDKGKTWKKVGEVVNDDTVHPDAWYKVSYKNGVPDTAEKTEAGTEGAICHPWSMHNCPQLFVLPEDMGDLKKGTLLCAGDAVTIEKDAKQVSDAGYGGLWDTSLDLYYSTDAGRSWKFLNTIATGGDNPRNIMGYDPVWEPFFLYHDNQLICYYSDETDVNGQTLVHKIMKDGKTWSEKTNDVKFDWKLGARPGMPIVAPMENGQWIMVYEGVGTSNPINTYYKIADDPYNWNPSEQGDPLPGLNGVYGGAPYVYTLQDGRVVAGTGSISEVFINTKKDCTGAWIPYETGAIDGYNRCYLQLSTGEFLINGSKGFNQQNNYIYVKSLNPDVDLKEKEEIKSSYYITSKSNEEVVGTSAGSLENGSGIMTWTNEISSRNQMWMPLVQEDGSYVIKNFASGRLLSVKEDGTLVQLDEVKEAGDAQTRQRWAIVKKEDGSFTVQSKANDKYLSAEADHAAVLADSADGAAQAWTFERLGDSTPEFGKDVEQAPVYKVTCEPAANGAVTADNEKAEKGSSVTFTITPAQGYTVKDVLVNGASVGKVTTYTLENISADVKVSAEFEKEAVAETKYSITIEKAENGTVTADKTQAEKGGSAVITVTPAQGYVIKDILVNGKSVGKTSPYTIKDITADVKVSAVFEKQSSTTPDPGTQDPGTQDPGTQNPGTTVPTPGQIENNNPGLPNGNSEESRGSKFASLAARATKSTKNSNKLQWTKVKGADGYIVLGNQCGKNKKFKTIKVINKNKTVSFTHKKLKKGTYYKYIVQAYKMEKGKLKIVATSKTIHTATAGGKVGNAKSLKVNKSKVTLAKKGKKFTIKAKEVKKDKTIKRHRKVSYESTNTKVAAVNSKGVITAKKKGTCYIYAYAQNGVFKKIKVTVKK